MPEYRLTCFGPSGNSYKAALYFALGGIEWTPVWINFFEGEHKSPEFLAKNDMGQVPLLEHGDVTLAQSGAILDYLVGQEGKFGWKDDAERREVMRWVLWDNYSFTSVVSPLRFIGHFLPEDKRDPNVLGWLKNFRVLPALKTLDTHLEGRDFVATDGLSIADLSIAGYLYYGDELQFDFAEAPNVQAWLDRIKAMPGWKGPYDLMPASGR